MKLVKACNQKQLKNVRKLYESAFPKEEKKPFDLLLEKQEQGVIEIFSAEDSDGRFYGLVIVVYHKDLVLLDYFAITDDFRGSGIGSEIFKNLKNKYKNKRFFIEIENTKIPSKNYEERIRRKNFYTKLGMKNVDFGVNLLGVEMEVMCASGSINYYEYFKLYDEIFGENISKNIHKL